MTLLRRLSRGISLVGHRLLVGDLAEALRFKVARRLSALEHAAHWWRNDWVYELDEIAAETDEFRYSHAKALAEWLRSPTRLGRHDAQLSHLDGLLDFIGRREPEDSSALTEAEQGELEALGARNAILEAENRRLRATIALADELGRISES